MTDKTRECGSCIHWIGCAKSNKHTILHGCRPLDGRTTLYHPSSVNPAPTCPHFHPWLEKSWCKEETDDDDLVIIHREWWYL